MGVNGLSLTARLRLTEAVRQAVKDDKKLSAAELVQLVAPLLDEYKVPAEGAQALVDGIVESFQDGSTVDPEAHKLLAGASAGFELGNAITPEAKLIGQMFDLMQKNSWNFMTADRTGSLGPAEVIARLTPKEDSGSAVGQPVRVEAYFYDGSNYVNEVHTTLGTQRVLSPAFDHEGTTLTSLTELQLLLERGMKALSPGKQYEEIGQGLDKDGHRKR